MSNRLTLRVHELVLQSDAARPREDDLTSAPPPALLRGRQAKRIAYVLADAEGSSRPGPNGDGAGEAQLLLRQEIHRTYYADASRSLTSSLLRACRSAHDALQEENARLVRGQRCYGRIACAVVREQEVYVALAGGGVAYLVSRGEVARLGGEDSDELAPAPVGGAAEADVDLFHRVLRPGEALIFATNELPGITSLHASTVGRLLQDFQRTYRSPNCRLLVIASDGGVGRLSKDLGRGELVGRGRGRSVAESAHLEDVVALRGAVEEEAKIAAAAGTMTLATPRPFATSFPRKSETAIEREAEEESDVQIGDRLVSFLEETGGSFNRVSHRLARIIAFLIAAVMLVLVLSVCVVVPYRIWQDRSQGHDTLNLIARAEQKEREALATSDPVQRRALMVEASELVNRAARAQKDEPVVAALHARLQTQLDEVDGVVRLMKVARLGSVDGEFVAFAQADSALVLVDSNGGHVQLLPLQPNGGGLSETGPQTIARAGDQLRGEVIAPIKAVAWIPAGSTRLENGLLLLTQTGQLIEHQPGKGLAAHRNDGVRGASQIAGYAGSLYVLSPAAGTLKWYMPTGRGYDGPSYDYFAAETRVNLSDVISMAVGGDLYLLRRSGKIERFAAGKPQPFDETMPDVPLRNPVALALTADALFVADAGNRRIVEFDADGRFRRQYRGESQGASRDEWLDDVRALAVDPARQRLFVVSRSGVYSVDLTVESAKGASETRMRE